MMFKLIIKNLWVRRRRNGWLLAELILVTVLTWFIADPVFVLSYNRLLPMGYRPDGLLLAPLNQLPKDAPGYQEEGRDSLQMMQAMDHLLQKVRTYPGVQYAAPITTFAYPGSYGYSSSTFQYDTIWVSLNCYSFMPHTDYFQTFGFTPLDGKTLKELDDMDFQTNNDLIVSADALPQLSEAGRTLAGKTLYSVQDDGKDITRYRIRGVVEKVRLNTYRQGMACAFQPQLNVSASDLSEEGALLIRLRPDVSETRFLHDFRPWANKHLRAGNFYVRDVDSYRERLRDIEYSSGISNQYRMNGILALFFLVNLALGVTGTFWFQTHARRGEVGVMMSYGATPANIRNLLMGEATVLTLMAWLVGCLLYLQVGVAMGKWYAAESSKMYWINHFGLHYVAVSLLVGIIILGVVLLGVSIPAHRLSHISPTEALREE